MWHKTMRCDRVVKPLFSVDLYGRILFVIRRGEPPSRARPRDLVVCNNPSPYPARPKDGEPAGSTGKYQYP
jgi:hypothetical protein